MPLFGRKNAKASQVRMGDMGGMVPLVQTPRGIQPLQQILDALWLEIATTAWGEYQQVGRGMVMFDPETGEMRYAPAEDLRELSNAEAHLALCRQYDPATQVVFSTVIVHRHGFRREPVGLLQDHYDA